jgi:hypothetical protein
MKSVTRPGSSPVYGGGGERSEPEGAGRTDTPSTMLRTVPLPRFAGEEPDGAEDSHSSGARLIAGRVTMMPMRPGAASGAQRM